MTFYISYKTSRDALGRSEMSFTVRIFGSLLVPSPSCKCNHLPAFTVIYRHLPSLTVVYHHVSPFTVIYHQDPWFPLGSLAVIYRHLLAFTTICRHIRHLPSLTVIYANFTQG